MIGNLAVSLAGHDKGQIYLIIREDGEYVYLCDGRLKTTEQPKRKNRKHIQIIKRGVDQELAARLAKGESVRDEEIKRMIKLYESKQSM